MAAFNNKVLLLVIGIIRVCTFVAAFATCSTSMGWTVAIGAILHELPQELADFLVEHKAINIHAGISPYYRGTDCNFWALYDDNPHLVGTTIHLLSKGLDSGPMLYHAMSNLKSNPFEYTMSTIKSAFHSIAERIKDNSIFKINPEVQDKSKEIRYSKKNEFNEEIVKEYFEKENIKTTFVGHPLIEDKENVKIVSNNLISKDRMIISIFPGSRKSETTVLMPILLDFIKLMHKKNYNYDYIFHATNENKIFVTDQIKKSNLKNIDVVSDENIKLKVLSNSIFAVSKSGTVSLQICNLNIPSIIIYKLSFLNFMIFKFLANIKFANIINIINDREVIPELLQKECNSKEIFNSVIYLLKNPDLIKKQLKTCNDTLNGIRSKTSSSNESALILNKYLNP